jgi:hypothetical protein
MKRFFVAVALVAFTAAPIFASAPPDTITLEAKNGNVTFNHKAHSEKMECKACHEGEPGKFELDKDKAHKLCKGCHQEKAMGPTKCNECHKK